MMTIVSAERHVCGQSPNSNFFFGLRGRF